MQLGLGVLIAEVSGLAESLGGELVVLLHAVAVEVLQAALNHVLCRHADVVCTGDERVNPEENGLDNLIAVIAFSADREGGALPAA